MTDKSELMLHDYLAELLTLLQEAQKKATHADTFADGRRMGLYEAFCLAADLAEQFNISTEALGLSGVEPDKFLK